MKLEKVQKYLRLMLVALDASRIGDCQSYSLGLENGNFFFFVFFFFTVAINVLFLLYLFGEVGGAHGCRQNNL